MGLGDSSVRKTHYPSLRQRLAELERFRSLVDLSSDLLFVVAHPSGQILDVSAASCERLGIGRSSLLSRSFSDLVSPTAWEATLALVEKLRRAPGQHGMVTTELTNSDSQRKLPVEIAAQYLQFKNSGVAILSARDITERKRAEEALRQSEGYLAEAQRLSHTGSWAWEIASDKYVYVSEECLRIFEFDPQEGVPTGEAVLRQIHPEDRNRWKENIEKSLREKADTSDEYRIVLPDGTTKHIHTIRHPVLNDAGDVVQLVGTSIDITERKRTEEALRQSEAYLTEAQKLTHTGSWAFDIASDRYVHVSEECLRVFGFDSQEVSPTREVVFRRIHPDDSEAVKRGFERSVHEKVNTSNEFRIVLPDGAVKTVHVTRHPVLNSAGDVVKLFGIAVDITERKQAEEALRESETRFRTFVDHAGDALFVQDLEQGTIVDVNRQACESLRYTRQELIGNTAVAFHPELDRAQMESVAGRAAAGETVFDTHWHRRKDGSTFPVEAHTSLFSYGGRRFLLNVARDISDRVRAEEKLRQDEMELRQIVDAVPQHIFVLEPDGRFLYVNRRDLEYSGLTLKDVHAADYLDRIWHPGDWERLGYDRAHAIAQGIPWEAEARLLGKDGQYRWFLIRLNPLRDEQGRIIRWYGTRTDIEDRKQAEEKVQQSEGELRQILNLTPQLVAVLEPDGRISYANEIMLQYTGLTLEDVRAEDFRSRVFHSDDVERVRDERQNALSRSVPFENEQRVLGKNGKYRWFFFRYNPLHDAQGRLIRWYASGTDVEDRKQAEERLQHENVVLREEIDKTSMFEEIVGTSAALQTVLSRVSKVAPTDSTVLLTGETGTGKELVARAIHRRSHRSSRAFVSVNCAAIPRDLIASELFGHEKGAFTGATQQRLGRFELAGGGTIFLDEVGELPAETQIALLRVLQEHEFERVGGNRSIQTDVRVIAATNRDLQAAIAAGTFRSDLFYRLNVFPIEIPPLRKRKEDIPLLVAYFIDRFARQAGKRIQGLNKKTLELFQSYPWPGNIRELQNVIERSVIVCETEIFSVDESWLSRQPLATEGRSPLDLTEKLAAQEKEMIEAALRECGGRVFGPSGAAAKLGMPRSTLESKIRTLKINKNRFKTAASGRDN